MYVNAFVLGVLATLFVEMALVITIAVVYTVHDSKHSHNIKRRG